MKLIMLGKALLFPHSAIMIILIPTSSVFLICSMLFSGTESPSAIFSYILAFYTLTVWCFKIPKLISFFKRIKSDNKYAARWLEDANLRINISLYGSLIWNTAYALFQLALGFRHHTFWYYSMAGYYIALAVMRFFLVRHTSRHAPGEKMRHELIRYRACGFVFLLMNLALSVMIFFMIYWNRTFNHHKITTIAMAAYTFTAFTLAVVNMIKYRKYNSPVYTASKTISLAAASVSMLTLESTMLTTFDDGTLTLFVRRLFLGISGGAVSAFIIVMAIYMIIQSNKKLKKLKSAKEFR